MKIETVAIKELTQDTANVRSHDERNISAITASLARFGQQKPIVVNPDGVVIAGNGTLAAAVVLGWTDLRVIRTDLAGAEAVAYAIADNRTGELAGWDNESLAMALAALQNDDDIDHLATGFTDEEIEAMKGDFSPVSIDDQSRLDTKSPITCPNCGEEFTPE